MEDLEIYKRALGRERKARKAAEQLLEEKAGQLFLVNQQLKELNLNLESTVVERTTELTQANARLATLVSNLNAGLLAEDEERKIILVNQKFCDIFSILDPPEMLLGVDCSSFAEQGKNMFRNADAFVRRIDQLLADRKLVIADQLETVDGRILERDFIPIVNEEVYLGHLWQYRDITLRMEADAELREARQVAEDAVQARVQFLANMSHEIRTPMNSILGMSDLLLKDALTEKQRNYISIINDSAENLLVVINDILDFSKVDAGKLHFEEIGFSLRDLAARLTATIGNGLADKGLELIESLDAKLPEVVIGDPYRLSQVLLNLLSNAVKFTDKGYVKLSMKLQAREATSAKVRFEVKDSGVGISPEKAASIFEDFIQVDASVTRKYGGTGLGLTISNKLVQLMGDSIQVESKLEQGSTFSFVLTFPIGSEADLPSVSTQESDYSQLQGKRLLLVEDHPYNQELALAIMEGWGMHIQVAENGAVALEILEKGSFDVVLMDVQMPVMDGIEATRQIRQRYGADLPVIALTANAMRSQEASLREGQMDGYISKPFKAEALQDEILRVMGLENSAAATKTTEEEVPVATALWDRPTLERQTGGNPEMTRRMLDIFLEMTPPIMVELKTATASRDLRKLENLAHMLKPSVKLMGMQAILPDTLQLEKASENGIGTEQAILLADKLVAHLGATLAEIQAEYPSQ